MKKLFLIPVAAALFTACSNETEPVVNDGPVALQISASNINVSTEVATRAADVSWGDGDFIGIIGVPTGEHPSSGENTVENGNVGKYTTTVTTATTYADPAAFTAETPVYLPANGAPIDVYGYYPWVSGTINPTAVTANIYTNQSESDNYYKSDFMRAFNNKTAINTTNGNLLDDGTAITRTDYTTVLNFKHKLSKLKFVITAGNGMTNANILAISSVTIDKQPLTATYNIYETGEDNGTNPLNVTDASRDSHSVTAKRVSSTESSVTYEAIVYPNKNGSTAVTNNGATDHEVTITIGITPSATYTFTIYDGVSDGGAAPEVSAFEAGKEYTFNVVVKAKELSVTAAITPWTTTTYNGVIAQ